MFLSQMKTRDGWFLQPWTSQRSISSFQSWWQTTFQDEHLMCMHACVCTRACEHIYGTVWVCLCVCSYFSWLSCFHLPGGFLALFSIGFQVSFGDSRLECDNSNCSLPWGRRVTQFVRSVVSQLLSGPVQWDHTFKQDPCLNDLCPFWSERGLCLDATRNGCSVICVIACTHGCLTVTCNMSSIVLILF